MEKHEKIEITERYAKSSLKDYESGHDWWHTDRVRRMSLYINEIEKSCDPFEIEIVSLLHDIADSKFSGDDRETRIDADRLDAIGAIGIARAFNYGGFRNNPIHDPSGQTKSTIGHFHEKLLILKGLMNTETGKRLAEERHAYLESFLKQFMKEWNGEI